MLAPAEWGFLPFEDLKLLTATGNKKVIHKVEPNSEAIFMTMPTISFKEHEGIVHNPVGQRSQASVPWWIGSPSVYGESDGQFKSSSIEHHAGGGRLTATKQPEDFLEQGNTTHFTIFPGCILIKDWGKEKEIEKLKDLTAHNGIARFCEGCISFCPLDHKGDCKTSRNGAKPSHFGASIAIQSPLPEYQVRSELGLGQHVICGKYPYGDHCYGVFSTYGPQIKGRIMLPLNLTMDDGPIYVNAKQYHGIIRRRLSRAKEESKKKLLRNRKPYLHLSRHLHAMRRARGCGGRFLNTKTSNSGKGGTETEKTWNGQPFHPTESQKSEVLQSDSGNMDSPKEANGINSNLPGSEVTSMFSNGDLDLFATNHLRPSVHSLSGMMKTGNGILRSREWVAVADSSCNLKV